MATTGTATPDISSLSYLQRPVKRMSITDLRTDKELEMQFNPAEMNESLSVNWARLHSPGLSHERLQYGNTDNMKWSFQLIYDELAFTGTKQGGTALASADARNFLMSLCYPRRGSPSVNDGAAPRVLFVWPNFISVDGVITALKFKHSRFNLNGQPTYFTVDVALEEMRDTRLFADDVAAIGTQRASDSPVKV
jgi:hypothetical protein